MSVRRTPPARREFIRDAALWGVTAAGWVACGAPPPPGRRAKAATPDIYEDTCVQTASDILGPKYKAGAPLRNRDLANPGEPGTPLSLSGRVLDSRCHAALGGTVLDVWQANDSGAYDDASFNLRGLFEVDASGLFTIATVLPGPYQDRPRHIHLRVNHGTRELITQIYFAGDPALAPHDPCGSCASDEPSLITTLTEVENGLSANFDIVLA